MREHSSKKACAIAGLAALTEALDLIGKDGATDHDMAQVITENESYIREMMAMFAERADLG